MTQAVKEVDYYGRCTRKNFRLFQTRQELGLTQQQVAKVAGVDHTIVNALENLRVWPSVGVRAAVAQALGKPTAWLFPPSVKEATTGESCSRTAVQDVMMDPTYLCSIQAEQPIAVPPSLQEDVETEEGKALLQNLVEGQLTDRECSVVTLYYGLKGWPDMTLEEVGDLFGVTRSRVRQIRDRALDKLCSQARDQLAFCGEELGFFPERATPYSRFRQV